MLHGVHVTKGERWSWILWFKNGCDSVPADWHRQDAKAGDPVAMFLMARRLLNDRYVDMTFGLIVFVFYFIV